MQVVAEEQAADANAAAKHKEAQKQSQVIKALQASKLRAERASRVTKLKVCNCHCLEACTLLRLQTCHYS